MERRRRADGFDGAIRTPAFDGEFADAQRHDAQRVGDQIAEAIDVMTHAVRARKERGAKIVAVGAENQYAVQQKDTTTSSAMIGSVSRASKGA